MIYKILENTGVEIENVDGAAFNNFVIAGKNCIIKGVLDECKVVKTSSNSFILSKGLLIIQGVRIKILEEQLFTMTSTPSENGEYQIVAEIELTANRVVNFSLYVAPKSELVKSALFATEAGVYQIEFGRFIYTTSGVIENLQTTLPVAYGTPETVGTPVDGLTVVQDEEGQNLLYLTFEGETVGEGIPLPQGGGGGGGGSSNNALLRVNNTTGWLSKTFSSGADVELKFNWSSVEEGLPTGNGTLKIYVGGSLKNSYEIQQGDVVVDVTKYITAGANDIKLEVADVYDNSRRLSYTINSVSVSLSSYFDGTTARTGAITYSYIPVGAVEKTVIFLIDGQSIGTQMVTPSGREQTFTIPAQPHGSHSFEVYFTATIDNQVVESNHLYYDLICYVDGNSKPIISVPAKITTAEQYSTVAIPYIVYTPNQLESDVILNDGVGNEVKLKVDRTLQKWPYKAVNSGAVSLSIISGETRKQLDFTVKETKIDVSAETENLQLYLSSVGRNNKEENPLTWNFGDINASFTGFNLVSDGWQLDENNNTVLRVAGDARVHIPFNIFETDARSTGKTIEIEFATRNVLNYDSEIITTWSNERGIKITAQKALLKSEQTEIFTQYKENETVRIAFVVGKQAEHRLLYIYINGIMSGVVQYATDDDFQQNPPVGITIGSNDCTTDIYTIRVYGNNLNRFQVLDNWIADTQDLTQMSDRYTRNNIFDDYDNIVVSKLPDDLPYLVLDVDSYGELPQSKGDKKTISGKYVDPLHANRSFDFSAAEIDVQGTSSQYYPRKNYKIKFKGGFIVAGNVVDTYKLRDTSMPTNEFTFKADVASSEGANNVELVRLYDDTCPVKTPPQEADSRVRQGIEGYPILMFYGNDSNLTFLGKYNFNNDKATPEVFGLKTGDESWEILQNNTDMVIWKDDDFSGTAWKQSFEARYPDGNTNTTKLQEFASWLKSTDTTAVTTDYEKQQRIQKFKDEFANYANVDAMLFNYIFTEMFLMVDNRAKNAFPTRYDEDGKWLILPYDYDTAIGINNEGELKFGYELEDTDLIDGKNVFNGQDSVLYVNMRLAFADEIREMYRDLRRGDVFSYKELEKRFEDHQSVWGEAVFNEDAKFKYIDPLVNAGEAAYLPMLQGSKAQQRKWWLYNRFRYIDSKYNAGDALEDFIVVRAYNVADIEVTPYADIYASAKFDSALVQKRALRKDGKQTLENPLTAGNDAVISIYSASQLSAIGDLSGLKVGMADFSKATKLSELKVGDGSASYNNPNLTDLQIGNLTLLKKLDVRNCSALAQSVDASGCTNIEEIYFDGTAITGLSLPNGGNLKKLHLPSTINNLTVLNQKQLSEFVLPTYSTITTLRVENTPLIDTFAIVNSIAANSRVRLVGINWTINNASDVLALMDKLDTMRGLDENGGNQDKAVVSGTIHVNELTDEQLAEMNTRYPNITITYGALNVSVKFYNGDALISDLAVAEGEQITLPANPTKESTAQYHYNFAGWSLDGVNVVEIGVAGNQDLVYYAVYTPELRFYTVRFLNSDGTVLQSESLAYGSTPTYTGASLDSVSVVFEGWSPAITTVTGAVDYVAVTSVRTYTVRFLNSDGTVLQTSQVPYGTLPTYTGDTPTTAGGMFNGWLPEITAVTGNIDYTAQFIEPSLAYSLNSDGLGYTVTGIGEVTDTDIVIPDTHEGLPVTGIASWAFRGNTNITSVYIPDSVITFGFGVCLDCTNLTSIRFPSSIKVILGSFCSNCSNLVKVNIPDSVTSIGNSAFNGCSSLTSIIIPDGVTSIDDSAFKYCTSLTSVTIPINVTSIGKDAFLIAKTTVFYVLPTTPPDIGSTKDPFGYATLDWPQAIYVPSTSLEAYKSATGWSRYADKIQPMS